MLLRFVLVLCCVGCIGGQVAWSCDDPDASCVCPEPPDDPPPPPGIVWMQESSLSTQPASHQAHRPVAAAPVKNWKIFPDKFQDIVKQVISGKRNIGDFYLYLSMILGTVLGFGTIGVLVHKGIAGPGVRRLFQIGFLGLWGLLFGQCLCSVKDIAVLSVYTMSGQWLYGLCTAWLGITAIAFTFVMRRRFRSAYCFWACPVGTAQDLLNTGIHKSMNRWLRVGVLLALAVVLVTVTAMYVPKPLNLIGGPVLAMVMIVLAIISILKPATEKVLRKFIFVSLISWAVLCVWAMSLNIKNLSPGPWCVVGVQNLKNPLVLSFLILMGTTLVMPRAWCNFVCPNRGLFELLSGKRRKGVSAPGDLPSSTNAPREPEKDLGK